MLDGGRTDGEKGKKESRQKVNVKEAKRQSVSSRVTIGSSETHEIALRKPGMFGPKPAKKARKALGLIPYLL